jgi:glycosyltransferase involved in cell wall biosynthesis
MYTVAGLLVTPSFYEGFGLPALEAQHAGCPVVVSNKGSLPEIVGERGITLDPEDTAAWTATMARVLADKDLREQLVTQGRRQAARFTWRKTAEQTLAAYRQQNS